MHEANLRQVKVDDPFWSPRLEVNATRALHHQWDQLEKTGCIDNFRIAAGEKEGFREGWFFADSDAYKWLDAACRVQTTRPSAALREKIDELTGLLARAQQADGYLYTYNQLHFPGRRWVNLQIEHELYCLGHLIEGCLSHDEMEQVEGGQGLAIACKAADLLVRELMEAGPECTDGHEEIELALVKLHHRTGKASYLDLAQRLVERRGRIPRFALLIRKQESSRQARHRQVLALRAAYLVDHPEHASFRLPPDNVSGRVRFGRQRRLLSALSGKMFQQDRPVRKTRVPVGHAVRFAYLQTAATMLARAREDHVLKAALGATWRRMVERRMYVTGGLGALPAIEGFGRDYELDPEASYSETCAALGSLFWNWQMTLLTGEACYADLFEWQLYNAASVGMGHDGTSYLYNNPLTCRGGIERRAWFAVPCCPSNLSRTWAALGRCLFSVEGAARRVNHEGAGPGPDPAGRDHSANECAVWVHQYVGCQAQLATDIGLRVKSGLPWQGRVRIAVEATPHMEWTLHLRIPSWTRGYGVRVNGLPWEPLPLPRDRQTPVSTACGYTPHSAFYVSVRRSWAAGDTVEIDLPMPIAVRRPSSRVRGGQGTAAITRGPLVYCLESVDNPGVDLFTDRVDLKTLYAEAVAQSRGRPTWGHGVLEEGLWILRGQTVDGRPLTLIPYFGWANRGPSQMNVMVRV